MTKVAIVEKVAAQIRVSEGPIELVDSNGQTIELVRRPPSKSEVARARSRANHGGKRLSWAKLVEQVRDGAHK